MSEINAKSIPNLDKFRVKVALIAPTLSMESAQVYSPNFHLFLAHLVQSDKVYTDIALKAKGIKILDNSYFELGYAIKGKELVRLGRKIKATHLVLDDGSEEDLQLFKQNGFKVMYVPTNIEQLKSALYDKRFDKVGLGNLWSYKMTGLDKNSPYARFALLFKFYSEKPFDPNKVHLLGSNHGMADEVSACYPYIGSWDSSVPIWSGLHGIAIKDRKYKWTEPVDFKANLLWSPECIQNIEYIEHLFTKREASIKQLKQEGVKQ